MVPRAGRGKKLIFLASARRLYAAELRADFRRYYHVSYGEVERSSPVEAADLAFLLPLGSCLKSAIDPALSWTRAEALAAATVNMLGALCGHKGPVVRVPEVRRAATTPGRTVGEVAELLSRPRREVGKCQRARR